MVKPEDLLIVVNYRTIDDLAGAANPNARNLPTMWACWLGLGCGLGKGTHPDELPVRSFLVYIAHPAAPSVMFSRATYLWEELDETSRRKGSSTTGERPSREALDFRWETGLIGRV